MISELTLSGTGRARGRQHGEELRGAIAEVLAGWYEALAPRIDPRAFVRKIFADSGLREPVERYTPELYDEVVGIAEGASQPLETVFAWQLIDECWWYLDEITGELRSHEACSAMAVNDGSQGFVAQTQDLYRHFDSGQVMLRYLEPDGLEILAPSGAGLLAYNGVNSSGVAVCITTLSQLAHQSGGVSSGFVIPTLLRCRSIDEALRWLRATPLASGNSWVLGTCDRSVAVEVSAVEVEVSHDGNRAIHTNHPFRATPKYHYPRLDSSIDRLNQLEATVRPDMSLGEIAAMYETKPICRSRAGAGPNDEITVATSIFELADTQRCHLGAGPLDTDELTTFAMSR